jgi:hypothetical protein
MNILKDYHYNWHKPFKAFKCLCRNCWQRITRGYCEWDLMWFDDYQVKLLINVLDDLEKKIWETSGERVDYREDNKPLPVSKLCDELFIAREQLKASIDRTVSFAERRALRDKAFKTINYYFDNLWW